MTSTKKKLILEYAKLATLKLVQGQKTVDARLTEIESELKMTDEAIMRVATQLATATLK